MEILEFNSTPQGNKGGCLGMSVQSVDGALQNRTRLFELSLKILPDPGHCVYFMAMLQRRSMPRSVGN